MQLGLLPMNVSFFKREFHWLTYAFAFFVLLCTKAQASSFEAQTGQVKTQLIASVDYVHPGDEVLVGVHFIIIPHWHIYWRNPGDSGLAPNIRYELPVGASAGEIQWPTPSRITLGPVTNYGYSNEVTLLTKIKVSPESVAGNIFPVKANAQWLVCEEICLPQEVDLELPLPIAFSSTPPGQGSPLIERALAALPVVSPWPISLEQNNGHLTLRIIQAKLNPDFIKDIQFFPDEWGRVVHGAEQHWRVSGENIELQLKQGDMPLFSSDNLSGVLAITEEGDKGEVKRGYDVKVPVNVFLPPALPAKKGEIGLVLASALLLALSGGIILNLMPCVFPVLSMKALHLIKHAGQDTRQNRLHGLAYTVGILVSFALLGGVLIILKTSGAKIGWGFQFQSPLFVTFMAYLMFTVGLNLSGVFSIGGSAAGIGSSLAARSGYSGSFFTGVLATLVATPCTAPFMGAALGFALTQSPVVLLSVCLSLGLGLALPYLLISQWPFLQRCLPKPGDWMVRLKQGLAFPMYGAASWLTWVLAQQAGVNSIAFVLGGLVVIAFAAWLYESTKYTKQVTQLIGRSIAGLALGLALFGGYFGADSIPDTQSANIESVKHFEPYSEVRLHELLSQGKPVFLNLTAAWCISCLVNEKVALSQDSVIDAFKRSGITYLKGDWTNRNNEISKILAEFGRSGVPLYVFYPPGSGKSIAPVVLPQILTPEIVIRAVMSGGKVDANFKDS